MKKIYYLGYYSDFLGLSNRKTAPAADTKMKYIISSLENNGYEVEVVSFCEDEDRSSIFKIKRGYTLNDSNYRVVFFSTITSRFRLIRVVGRMLTWQRIKTYVKRNCLQHDADIIVYHSLSLLKLLKFLYKNGKDFILEMEEVYSDVICKPKLKNKEIAIAKKAAAYIFPTKMLSDLINHCKKPEVIIHGTYNVEESKINKKFRDIDGRIHCLYAGTFDPRKGVCLAIDSAKALPSNYHIHIIGFGTKQEVENVKNMVKQTSSNSLATITYDGLLLGDEYIRFIQQCDIGLSPQDPSSAFNSTSFPSKILSYLANGLQVVSIKIPAIYNSEVGSNIYYYEEYNSQSLAKAIVSVDLYKTDSRNVIRDLSSNFEKNIVDIIER